MPPLRPSPAAHGWAARCRPASLAPADAVDTLIAHRGIVADVFVCPGWSMARLEAERKRRGSVSVADFRREEERLPTRKLGTRLQHRVPLPLKIPIPAVDFRDLANAPRGTAPKKPVHAPTPHPAASGNSILAGSPVNHPAGGEHMELSFEVAHVPSPVSLQPARFVGHQISAKFGRGWGKYNPVHVPICDVEDVEAELAKPNFGCKRLLCASKADIAKLNDRRSGAMAVRDATGTLHSTFSYSAYDPYGTGYKETFDPGWSWFGRVSSAAPVAAPKTDSHTRPGRKRLVGKGTMIVHIPDESDGAGGDVPTYNVTNSIASGLSETQILIPSLLAGRQCATLPEAVWRRPKGVVLA